MAKENPAPVKRSYLYRSTYVWLALALSLVSLGSTIYVSLSFPLMLDWMDYLWPIPLSFLASFLLILILGREAKALDDHRVESSPEYILEADAKRMLAHAIFIVGTGTLISASMGGSGNFTVLIAGTIFTTAVLFSVIFEAKERATNSKLKSISYQVDKIKEVEHHVNAINHRLSAQETLMREMLKDLKDFKKTAVDLSSSSLSPKEIFKDLSDDIDSLRDDSSKLHERFIKLEEGISKQLEGKEIFRSMSYWEINERVKDMIVLLQDQDKYIRSVVTGPHRDLFIDANLDQNVMPALYRIEHELKHNMTQAEEQSSTIQRQQQELDRKDILIEELTKQVSQLSRLLEEHTDGK